MLECRRGQCPGSSAGWVTAQAEGSADGDTPGRAQWAKPPSAEPAPDRRYAPSAAATATAMSISTSTALTMRVLVFVFTPTTVTRMPHPPSGQAATCS
jgi:hypothetical protein